MFCFNLDPLYWPRRLVCGVSKTQAKWISLDSCHVPILEEETSV